MSRTGRPSIFSDSVAKVILRHIRNGCTKDDAAAAAGIAKSTFYEWQASKPEFAEAVTRARESLKPALVGVVRKHARTDWRAAIAMLERMTPDGVVEDWRRPNRVIVGGDPDGAPVRLDHGEEMAAAAKAIAALTTDELRALASRKAAE